MFHLQVTNENAYEVRYEDGTLAISEESYMRHLDVIDYDKKYDRSFIRTIIEILYSDDLSDLMGKCLFGQEAGIRLNKNGTSTVIVEKKRMTPKKVKIIRDLFSKRIESQGPSEHLRDRYSTVSQAIGNAINSIQRRLSKTPGTMLLPFDE